MIKFKKLISAAVLGVLSVGLAVGAGVASTNNFASEVEAAGDVVAHTINLGNHTGRPKQTSYTGKYTISTAQTDATKFDATVDGGANNNGGWAFTRFGKKKSSSATAPAYVQTTKAIGSAVTKVDINVVAFQNGTISSFDLYSGDSLTTLALNNSLTVGKTEKVGINTITIANPTPNLYYKLEINYDNKSSTNGSIDIDRIDFYKSDVAVTLESLEASVLNNKQFYAGEVVKNTDLLINAVYSDGSKQDVTSSVILPETQLVTGENILNLSYTEDTKTVTFDLVINAKAPRVATDLVITGSWDTITYVEGQEWDLSKLQVAVKYNDNSLVDITNKIGSSYLTFTFKSGTTEMPKPVAGTTSVSVAASYYGDPEMAGVDVTTSVPLTLSGFTVDELTLLLSWSKYDTIFKVGEKFAITGSIYAHYNDGRPGFSVDMATAVIDVYFNGKKIDIASHVLSLADDGTMVKLSVGDGTLVGFTKEVAITVTDSILVEGNIGELQKVYKWGNGTEVPSFEFDVVTVKMTKQGTTNSKYYNSGTNWRVYTDGIFEINVPYGYELRTVALSYSCSKGDEIVGFDKGVAVDVTGRSVTVGPMRGTTKFTNFAITYKKLTAEETATQWANEFLTSTDDLCSKLNVTAENWKQLGDEYATLPAEAKTIVEACKKLSNTDVAANDLEKAAQRYDYIVAKYGFNDFANRGITSPSAMINFVENDAMIITVIIVSILAVSTIAFLTVSKRRKVTK